MPRISLADFYKPSRIKKSLGRLCPNCLLSLRWNKRDTAWECPKCKVQRKDGI